MLFFFQFFLFEILCAFIRKFVKTQWMRHNQPLRFYNTNPQYLSTKSRDRFGTSNTGESALHRQDSGTSWWLLRWCTCKLLAKCEISGDIIVRYLLQKMWPHIVAVRSLHVSLWHTLQWNCCGTVVDLVGGNDALQVVRDNFWLFSDSLGSSTVGGSSGMRPECAPVPKSANN